jgi:TRAP-type transport system periplasmic protein
MKRFGKRMQDKAGGRVKVELFPLGQLGTIPRAIEGMQLGTVEAYVTPSVFMVGVDKRSQVTWAPGMFDSIDHCWRTIGDKDFRDEHFHWMDSKGITIFSIICSSTQAFLTKKDVRGLKDLDGLKIRVLASKLERSQMLALGISPTPIPFTEVLPALQRNVIDGVSSIPILFTNLKMYNTAKHITIGGLFNSSVPIYVSKAWWDRLPADLKTLMTTEARAVEESLVDWNEKANAETLERWKANGGTVRTLSDAEQKHMLDTVAPAVEAVMKEDPQLDAAYRKILAAADKYR